MDELLKEMSEDVKPGKSTDATVVMQRVGQLVNALREAERRCEEAERKFKEERAALLRIEREDLPELMREGGFEKLTLVDGTSVSVMEEISCSITEERASAAHAWLRDNGLGSIIKTLVSVAFGKNDLSRADELYAELLRTYGDAASETEKVHPSTLKAALKEALAEQKPVPLELFGVVPFSIAKVKERKA